MKPIVSFIAALFTVSLFTQCTPKASSEQPRSNVDIAEEIMDEIYDTYSDSSFVWKMESYFTDALIMKAGITIDHEDNDSLKFLDLVTRINRKIEDINSYRIFSDRQNDDKGISGRYIVSVHPDEGDDMSTLFYNYKRSSSPCTCPHNQYDSISFVFTVNAGTKTSITQDIRPGLRGTGDRRKLVEASTAEDMKPIEDFFQTYYNDSRAIRRQATYRSDKINGFAVYVPTAAYTDGDTLTTNAIYSLRPYTGDTELEELYSLAERYKRSPICDLVIMSGENKKEKGDWFTFLFNNEKEIRTCFQIIFDEGVFALMKATAADEKGLCIEAGWWR
ncbi:MAG: hypothetical protein IKJ09_01215 [Bacteroidaceae bacterium]|nr:hypothetical protein [Bacteroidaceae bacterium]